MDHDNIRHKLSDYIDDALSPDERFEIEQHLASCAACGSALNEIRKTVELLRGTEEAEPPSWLPAKIMANVREEAARRRTLLHRLFFPLNVKVPLQAVAMLFLAVTAFYLYQSIRPDMKFAGPPAPGSAFKKDARKSTAERPAEIAAAPEKRSYAPPAPGYRSLDMKYSYESPEEPELKGNAGPPAAAGVPRQEPGIAALPEAAREAEDAAQTGSLPRIVKPQSTAEVSQEQPLVRIELVAADISSALKELDRTAKDLSARVLSRDSRSLTLELDAANLPELTRRLKEIGSLRTAPEQQAPSPGLLRIIILLFGKE